MPSETRTLPQSPLIRLPPELLSEIFLWYIHHLDPCSTFSHGVHYFCNDSTDPNHLPPEPNNVILSEILLLGSISRSIRTTAWATPQLWTHIHLALSPDHVRRSLQIAGLTSWLARSGECPLHIHLQCSIPPLDTQFPSRELIHQNWVRDPPFAAMEAIMAHCAHWEDICLVIPHGCYMRFPQSANKRTMHMLKRLMLHFERRWLASAEDKEVHIDTFAAAEALTEVSLLGFSSRSIMPALPWGQVTRFRGHHLQLVDALDVLRSTPLLEALTLVWALGMPSVLAPLLHKHLRTLTIEECSSVLKHLTLPALETLRVNTDLFFAGQQCVRLLQRSRMAAELGAGCKMTSLHISVNFCPATTLIECLEAAPTLQELKVHNHNDRIHSLFADFVVGRLTIQNGKLDLMLQLRCLEVRGCSCQFDVEALGEMLWSRWASSVPAQDQRKGLGDEVSGRLDYFYLGASSEVPSTIQEDVMCLPQVCKLIEAGMVVRMANED